MFLFFVGGFFREGFCLADEEDGKELDAAGRACDRSWTMRAGYLSQDRCELQFPVKELARRIRDA